MPPSGWTAPQNRPYTPPRHDPATGHRHRRNNRQLGIIVVGIVFAALVVAVAIVVTMSGKNVNTLTTVQQPPTAAQVANQFGCTGFKDIGPSQAGGVIDSGTCMKGGVKYALDTFPSTAIRDSWLKEAEQLGVNPLQETSTAVIYKSVGK